MPLKNRLPLVLVIEPDNASARDGRFSYLYRDMSSTATKKTEEWSKYAIDQTNSTPFTKVHHVTHVDTGLKILKDQLIRPALISDKSVLNTERILVNWLSPNHWNDGYLYGNVRFAFDMETLMKDKRVYWVEYVPYETPAVRFLITDRQHFHPKLILYDLEKEEGPLVRRSGKYSYNGTVALELMIEAELSVDECIQADFVQHHPELCGLKPRCSHLGMRPHEAATRLLGYLMTQPLVDGVEIFLGESKGQVNSRAFEDAITRLLRSVDKTVYRGEINGRSEEEKKTLLSSFCSYLITYEREKFRECISVFSGKEEVQRLLYALLTEKLGITDFSDLE